MKSQSWPKEFTDLDEVSNCYNSTLSSLLYNYAPLKSTVLCRKHSPWFNHIIEKLRKQLNVEEWLKEMKVGRPAMPFIDMFILICA